MDRQELSGSPRRKKNPIDLDTALYLQSQASHVQEPNCRPKSSSQLSLKRPPLGPSYPSNGQPPAGQLHGSCHPANYYNSNAISVDYIDCVSNSDLPPPTMRGFPHCKKHLRFHRNRIGPDGSNEASLGTNSNNMNQQEQLSLDEQPEEDSLHQINNADNDSNQHHQSSILYPIPVVDVRQRTHFIGSLSEAPLMGQEDLQRYFPNGMVNIFVCTWNQNRKRAPMNLNELLLPNKLHYMADIYAIGIQEAHSSNSEYLREWEVEIQTTLGPAHVLLHSCSLGALHLSVFVRRDLIWFCSTPEESVYNSRSSMATNLLRTKGAVSIAFRFFGTSFMFTNCHFPAHENRLKDRIDEYQRIINSIDLPKNLKLLKPRYLSNDSTARFDCVFFIGDLNFRLEHRTFDETIHILEDIFQHKEPSFEMLTQNDELLKVMETQQAFHGFDESYIRFPPTYKFLAKTNKYDRQTKRVPSYTDRILFRSKRQRHIQCLLYDWLPQLVSSDHKPVYSVFNVLIRPSREEHCQVSNLNAGMFQRNIYLEALKRLTAEAQASSDMMKESSEAGTQNLICSIS